VDSPQCWSRSRPPSPMAWQSTEVLGADYVGFGVRAGLLGAIAIGLVTSALGGAPRLISAPCAPAAAVLSALVAELATGGPGASGPVSTRADCRAADAGRPARRLPAGSLRSRGRGRLINTYPTRRVRISERRGRAHLREPGAEVLQLAQGCRVLVGLARRPLAMAGGRGRHRHRRRRPAGAAAHARGARDDPGLLAASSSISAFGLIRPDSCTSITTSW